MKKIITFHLLVLFGVCLLWLQIPLENTPNWVGGYLLPLKCILMSSVGGALYCLRAVYVNKCVNKNWDVDWETWYYLRPVTSAISGFVAFVFLKAGLIVLEANQVQGAGDFGFLAFAFVAGLNVDKFVLKIEDVAKAVFGIEKSRASESKRVSEE
ncbi:hypothetical protein [Teredinibacter turnerae]|uniref:hypothetical protein n=1 Tax=Teredinibacter turnerae TaxID=2426 RepID=UPI0004905883|nr:hypothetical protein [Teredinibacter turnerae]